MIYVVIRICQRGDACYHPRMNEHDISIRLNPHTTNLLNELQEALFRDGHYDLAQVLSEAQEAIQKLQVVAVDKGEFEYALTELRTASNRADSAYYGLRDITVADEDRWEMNSARDDVSDCASSLDDAIATLEQIYRGLP